MGILRTAVCSFQTDGMTALNVARRCPGFFFISVSTCSLLRTLLPLNGLQQPQPMPKASTQLQNLLYQGGFLAGGFA